MARGNLNRRPVAPLSLAVIEIVGKKLERSVRILGVLPAVFVAAGLCSLDAAAQSGNPAPTTSAYSASVSSPVPAATSGAKPAPSGSKENAPKDEGKPASAKAPGATALTKAGSPQSASKTSAPSSGSKPQTLPPSSKPQPNTSASPKPPVAPVTTPVSSQSSQSTTEQAKLVYDQAVAAYEEHRYRDAIDLFQQADALRPNPAFSFNIGTAYEDMGDSAMALLYYRAYLRQLPKAFDREDVENRIRRLEGVLADKGLQQVTIISNPAEAMVILDGKPRGVSPWTGEVAPGAHVVTLSLQGYADETRDFDLPSRRSIDVPVTLKRAEPKPVTPIIDLNKRLNAEPKASWEHIRPVTWGVLGVSVASFGAALGFELSRSALEERSQQADSEVGRAMFHEDARRSEMWAKSFLMFAVGMGATSLVLGYQNIDDGLREEHRRREQVSFGCVSTRECGVSVSGSF